MRWKILVVTALIALAASFALACDDNGGEEPEATEAMDATEAPDDGEEPADGDGGGGREQAAGGGSATLAVGDETYEFSGYMCAFGEETQNPDVEFSSTAFGESETGARTQLSVDITLGIHAVTLGDVEDFENPSVSWEGVASDGIQIDGKNISAEATFDDGTTPDVLEEIAGTFEGTCP